MQLQMQKLSTCNQGMCWPKYAFVTSAWVSTSICAQVRARLARLQQEIAREDEQEDHGVRFLNRGLRLKEYRSIVSIVMQESRMSTCCTESYKTQ